MKRALAAVLALLAIAGISVGAGEVREPVVAGTFYPADSAALAAVVEGHLQAAPAKGIDGDIVALIVPHAGLVYSGAIAANAYRLLDGQNIETIVLCGPSHRYRFRGASVYGPEIDWDTPIGRLKSDSTLASELLDATDYLTFSSRAHTSEHSIEVQLPYIRTVLPEARIVPISFGAPMNGFVSEVSGTLAQYIENRRAVLVASTDWQHYRSAAEGYPMDSLGMACLKDLDADRLARLLDEGKVEACGGLPAVTVIKAAVKLGANRVKILEYGDSGDISGDKSSVVGYVAAVLYESSEKQSSVPQETEPNMSTQGDSYLTDAEKERLLNIARQSIAAYLTTGNVSEPEVTGKLAEPGAAFVTLEMRHRLRGCIGHTMAVQSLAKTVAVCAVKAAVNDPRFAPVSRDELPDIHIEISVLTPLEAVEDVEEIEVGRDGLMITRGPKRGLLLPQVATDYGWTRDEFLRQTCRKAGLPSDAYLAPDCKIERFRALVFGEPEPS